MAIINHFYGADLYEKIEFFLDVRDYLTDKNGIDIRELSKLYMSSTRIGEVQFVYLCKNVKDGREYFTQLVFEIPGQDPREDIELPWRRYVKGRID